MNCWLSTIGSLGSARRSLFLLCRAEQRKGAVCGEIGMYGTLGSLIHDLPVGKHKIFTGLAERDFFNVLQYSFFSSFLMTGPILGNHGYFYLVFTTHHSPKPRKEACKAIWCLSRQAIGHRPSVIGHQPVCRAREDDAAIPASLRV